MSIRDSILEIAVPFLKGFVGTRLLYSSGLALDATCEWMMQGAKAAMPGRGPSDALHYIGRDRNLERGPTETDDHYAARLSQAFDTWATAGAAPTLLVQLANWFSPSTTTPVRLVSNAGTWHTIDYGTQVVTKTVAANWTWDVIAATAWWRGWVVIDASSLWTPDKWSPILGTWGDGGTWGSDATISQVEQLRSIVAKWKPANITAQIIVTFDSSLFEPGDTAPPNPNGTSDTSAWRVATNAIYWNPST